MLYNLSENYQKVIKKANYKAEKNGKEKKKELSINRQNHNGVI